MSGDRPRMRLTVIGIEHPGLTHAVRMAELGHQVLALDSDHDKIARAARGELQSSEPGLAQLVRKNLDAGRLHFTTSYAEVAEFGDVHFLCVGTSEAADGTADVRHVYAAVAALASRLTARCLVVGKSRVPVGTARVILERIRAAAPAGEHVDLAWDPEFLDEGFTVRDARHAPRPGAGSLLKDISPVHHERDKLFVGDLPSDGKPADRISVVIPARNEARNLPHVLQALPAGLHEVILVDGHSVDDTIEVTRRLRPDVKIVQQTRRGKGNALACGFAEVTGDLIVMLDADGSADPGEIPAFVAALAAGAEFAKGTRFSRGGGSHDITRLRRLGNAALNCLVNLLFGTCYTDLCYGYNAFRVSLLPALDLPSTDARSAVPGGMLWGDGFEIETLINVRVSHAGARITEIGSMEKRRIHGVSNLNAVSDGIRVLRTILSERKRAYRIRREAIAARRAMKHGLVTAASRADDPGDTGRDDHQAVPISGSRSRRS
jgi:glycosyltransferase involved in cell wall biosynthesis